MTIEEKYQEKCRTPSDINEHLPTLRRYAQGCRLVIELGVRSIVSTWAFLAGEPKFLISVDSQHPREVGGNLEELQHLAADSETEFKFIQGDSREFAFFCADLLFIDTRHDYEQLKAELEKHAPRVQKFIILHDTQTFGVTGETPGHVGLWPAVEELLAAGQWKVRERFTNNNGLTVLERVA